MHIPAFGFFRRAKRSGHGQNKQSLTAAPNPGLEPLEERVLLSGVSLIDPPPVDSYDKVIGADGTYTLLLPDVTEAVMAPSVSGKVFLDDDGDGLLDPSEYRLQGVSLFADLDGNGKQDAGEKTATTDGDGYFRFSGLPTGTYDIHVLMPDGYMASTPDGEGKGVAISPTSGMRNMQFGLTATGFDLTLRYSDISMPARFKTGTRVKIPVILSNQGNEVLNANNIQLRVYLSEGSVWSDDDTMVAKIKHNLNLQPGESIKLNLEVNLPDSLSAFNSYVIVKAVGYSLRADVNAADNTLVSDTALSFSASGKASNLNTSDLDIVLAAWNNNVPYGGYTPGYGYDGYVGLSDLNIELGNWNAGTPPTQEGRYYNAPTIGTIQIEGGSLVRGEQTRISVDSVTDSNGTVRQVMFFYDRNYDGVLEDLLGVDTDGSDGYSILSRLGKNRTLAEDSRVVVVAMDNNGELAAKSINAQSRTVVEVTAGKKLVFRNEVDAITTIALSGRGSAEIQLSGEGFEVWDVGNAIEVTGFAYVNDIQLVDTSGRSKLRFSVRGDETNTRQAILGVIKGSTPLGVLDARGCSLVGGIEMTGNGVIRRIRADKVGAIHMEGVRFSNGVVIEADEVNGDINLSTALRLLAVDHLWNVDVTASSAGKIIIKKDYVSGTLSLTDSTAEESLALLQVGKKFKHVNVQAASSIGTIRANAMRFCTVLAAEGSLFDTPASVLSTSTKRCAIEQLTVGKGGFVNSSVAAWRIGEVNLKRVVISDSAEEAGLYYRKLGSYNGPEMVQLTMV